MTMLGLDLASRCGVADGRFDCDRPFSYVWHLRQPGTSLELAARNLGCELRDRLSVGDVTDIWVEDYMDPVAHPDNDSIKIAILLRGTVEAVSACYAVDVHSVDVNRARKAFCGKSSFNPPRRPSDPPWSREQAERRRLETKAMIWRAAVRHGLIPAGDRQQFDRSDAVCVWSFGATEAGRAPPLSLGML